jgi:hypothetical protein
MTKEKQARPGVASRAITAWAQLADESSPAFAAFTVYRDLPVVERSIRAAAEACGKHIRLLERWSRKYAWVARVRAWDAENDRVHCEGVLKSVSDRARELGPGKARRSGTTLAR